jgi:hypothetical protein
MNHNTDTEPETDTDTESSSENDTYEDYYDGNLHEEISSKTMDYIKAGIILVASLAWSDVIKSIIMQIYPFSKGDKIHEKVIYAIIVTVAVVIAMKFIMNRRRNKALKNISIR